MSDSPHPIKDAAPARPAASPLKQRLQSELTDAMRARDELVTATLRMALTAVRAEEVSGSVARGLDDSQVEQVLAREAKKRREAASAFDAAGRKDRAARERAELAVLEGYLPAQLSDEDLARIVGAAVADAAAAGVSGMPAMGRVMKTVQPQVKGLAEGGRVAAEVRRLLSAS